MSTRDAYLFYEAGQAVAAVHLGLPIRSLSANPALAPSDIALPKNNHKPRMILWLTGMAAEKKALGKSSPLRRTRNRQRLRSLIDAYVAERPGPLAKRHAEAKTLMNQAQDRANAICSHLFDAISQIADLLRAADSLHGDKCRDIVLAVKKKRSDQHLPNPEDSPLDSPRSPLPD